MSHHTTVLSRAAAAMLALSATFAILIAAPSPAWACSCAEPPPPTQALDEADAVFLGEIVETRRVGGEFDGELIARVAVEEVWKGEVAELVDVHTEPDSAMCGYGFTAGDRDLLYAQHDDDSYSTHLCTRSAPVEAAEEDLAAFGEGRAPVAGEQLTGDGPSWFVLGAVGLTILVAAALVVGWRFRRSPRP